MREIVLDTETTGFDPETGDRVVEIGCVELNFHVPTGMSTTAISTLNGICRRCVRRSWPFRRIPVRQASIR